MSQFFSIHPTHPQRRLLSQAAQIIADGGLVAYPTDACYALACHVGDKRALERIRSLRNLSKQHFMTLCCRDLSVIAEYARVDNSQYRLLKHFTPGPFTFLLRAGRDAPKRLVHPKRKTLGIRVLGNPIAAQMLELLHEPIMSTTLRLPGDELPLADPVEIRERLQQSVDLVIDGGTGSLASTTIVDLTRDVPQVLRQGAGEFV